MFKFISHETLDDPYTKEVATIELTLKDDSKIRIGYIRKETREGRKFWSPMSTFALKEGEKTPYQAVQYDSNFLANDIKQFLDSRGWERPAKVEQKESVPYPPKHPMKIQPVMAQESSLFEGVPF